MTKLSRRKLFGFIAAMPLAVKAAVTTATVPALVDGGIYWHREYSLGYAVTREELVESNALYELVSARRDAAIAGAVETYTSNLMNEGFNAGDWTVTDGGEDENLYAERRR